MPAAEPGDVHRAGRDPVRRREAEVPQADRAVGASAARPRAVHPVRPLHPLRRPGRGRSADRADRPGPARAGRGGRGRAVRLLLLRQHRADLPGRRADRRLLPVPGAAVRPGLESQRLRALRGRLPAAHRPPARCGHAAAGGQRPRGQRGMELRQGPLGVHLRNAARPARGPARARRVRRAPARVLARGNRDCGQGTSRGARPRGRAARRPPDGRGRLRLRQVRQGGPGNQ